MKEELYLGVDGGQSHTEAVVADQEAHVLGRGRGGPSSHAEQEGGEERLRRAIADSVGSALEAAGRLTLDRTTFAAAHCAMTGGAYGKEEVIRSMLRAGHLEVGHDAPAALASATGGGPGIVVIAGTGSVAYGERANGQRLCIGEWGYLFADEGSAYWIALQGLRRAMMACDGLGETTTLGERALQFFDCPNLRMLVIAVQREDISRARLAAFAVNVNEAAETGDGVACEVIREAGKSLPKLVVTVASRLGMSEEEAIVACVGGVFRGALVRKAFASALGEVRPTARIIKPLFDPAIGALLLAYRAAGRSCTESLLANLSSANAGRLECT